VRGYSRRGTTVSCAHRGGRLQRLVRRHCCQYTTERSLRQGIWTQGRVAPDAWFGYLTKGQRRACVLQPKVANRSMVGLRVCVAVGTVRQLYHEERCLSSARTMHGTHGRFAEDAIDKQSAPWYSGESKQRRPTMETKKIWAASYWYAEGDYGTRSETCLFYDQEQAQAWVEQQLRGLHEDEDETLVLSWCNEGQNKWCAGETFAYGEDQGGLGGQAYEYQGAVEIATFG